MSQSGQASVEKLALAETLTPVKGCRTGKKTDMAHNADLPTMEIDAQT